MASVLENNTSFSLTENGALAHKSTGSVILDLFINLVRTKKHKQNDVKNVEYIDDMMTKGWKEDKIKLVKLIYQTRDIRDGKGERDLTYKMLEWLNLNKPLTYKDNIKIIASEYGRFEDLLEMSSRTNRADNIELVIYAKQLQEDLDILNYSENKGLISLAGKWAPSEGGYYGKQQKKLARLLFPNSRQADKQYRKEVLTVLRNKINVLENLMCHDRWTEINFEHVPAQAMFKYGKHYIGKILHTNQKTKTLDEEIDEYLAKTADENIKIQEDTDKVETVGDAHQGAFYRHIPDLFEEYHTKVNAGTAKINTQGLQPGQLVRPYITGAYLRTNTNSVEETIELQWKTLIDKLKKTCILKKAVAVVDVSGSMNGEPMENAIALGLVISELTDMPFRNKIITFDSTPQIINILGDTLYSRVLQVTKCSAGTSTNFEKTLDLILGVAIQQKIKQADMIDTLFVFTDMQFDAASHSHDRNGYVKESTLYTLAQQKYSKYGYVLPKIVFWNLRKSESSSNAFPVTISNHGTVFLSGFSSELLKMFVEGTDFNPLTMLDNVLAKYNVIINEQDDINNTLLTEKNELDEIIKMINAETNNSDNSDNSEESVQELNLPPIIQLANNLEEIFDEQLRKQKHNPFNSFNLFN